MQNQLKFIDNHTHGAFGIDFNKAGYNDIKYLLKELYKRNIVALCPTLVGDNNSAIQNQLAIFKKIKQEQLTSKENEAFIIGAHLEGSFLSPEKSGIQDKNVFLKPSVDNFKKLAGNYEDIVKIVTVAPEEDIDLIDYLNDKNIITQAGHTIGDDLKNTKGVTHLFNAMKSIHHRDKSIALSSLINDNIYCEIIADLIHCSKDILELFLKVKPKDKIILISDSLPCANYKREIIFCNKKIYPDGKDENKTIAGSIYTLDTICNNLIEKNILTPSDINQMAYFNQIKYLNLKNEEIDILNQ